MMRKIFGLSSFKTMNFLGWNLMSSHIKSIYGKLQVHSESEAVAKALRQKLFESQITVSSKKSHIYVIVMKTSSKYITPQSLSPVILLVIDQSI